MEALPPRFNKLRRASGPAEIDNNRIRFYPVSYSRRVGFTPESFVFNLEIYCQIKNKKNEFLCKSHTDHTPWQ
jgi:hypothetical protein